MLRALVQEQQGRQQNKVAARDRLDRIVAISMRRPTTGSSCARWFVTGRGTGEDDAWDAVTLDMIHAEIDLCGLEVDDYNVT